MANSLKKSENDKFKPDSSPYLPNYTMEEETRFTMAKIQFDNFHYLKCIQCLGPLGPLPLVNVVFHYSVFFLEAGLGQNFNV